MQAALKRYPDGIPLLDPVEDMGIEDEHLTAAVRATEELEAKLAQDPVFKVTHPTCPLQAACCCTHKKAHLV